MMEGLTDTALHVARKFLGRRVMSVDASVEHEVRTGDPYVKVAVILTKIDFSAETSAVVRLAIADALREYGEDRFVMTSFLSKRDVETVPGLLRRA